jgi:hypothetical protein
MSALLLLQCVLKGGQHVDVSISSSAGPAAATYLRDKVTDTSECISAV